MKLTNYSLECFLEGSRMGMQECKLAAKEIKILRQLQEYVEHKEDCGFDRYVDVPECTCGLSALLKELEGV